jgi:hypothetical protein
MEQHISQNSLGMAVGHAFTAKMLIAKKKQRLQYLGKSDSKVTIDRRTAASYHCMVTMNHPNVIPILQDQNKTPAHHIAEGVLISAMTLVLVSSNFPISIFR